MLKTTLSKLSAYTLAITASMLLLATTQADEPPKLLIVGDSLSAGYQMDLEASWTTLLQNKLDELGYGYKVINASISGDTTSGGLRRLPRSLKVHQPEIVVIELGGNDGLQGAPVDMIRSNLTSMITLSKDTGAKVIITGIQMPPNYGGTYTEEFMQVFFDVAKAQDVAIVPFILKNIALTPSLMQADGIHPTAEAQSIVLDNMWEIIEPALTPPR